MFEVRLCSKCKQPRLSEDFTTRRKGLYGVHCQCKICLVDDRLLRVDTHKAYLREYRTKFSVQIALGKRRALDSARIQGIAAYGGKCECCGEDNPAFLTLDHINGRMLGEKREELTGKKMWARLRRLKYPKGNYQLLCFNCNCAKSIYGVCPHKLVKSERTPILLCESI